jgi:hypothetical protein
MRFINEFNEKEIADCLTYACSYAIDNLLMSGKVETLNVFCDLTGVTASFNAPTTLIQNVALTHTNQQHLNIITIRMADELYQI